MKILELSANKESFRTVKFNESGVTLIVGTTSDKSSKKNQTYNGVGKSLIIELIHFCLGSKSNSSFEELLPDWEFTLILLNDEGKTKVTRSTNNQNVVIWEGKEIPLASYTEKLQSMSFNLDLNFDSLTFRSLINRFIRRKLDDYIDPLKLSNDYSDYHALLKASFLLDLDLGLIYKKHKLKTQLDTTRKSSANFKKDELMREFFLNKKDEDIELSYLDEEIKKLETNRERFKVAEDYYDLEMNANSIKEQLNQLRNQSIITKNTILKIEKSLQVRPDIPAEKLLRAYEELLNAFKENTIQHFKSVEEFHNSLMKNRVARLSQEKIKQLSRLKEQEESIKTLHNELDKLVSYLGTNKALDELVMITNKISELKEKAQRIVDYKSLSTQYKKDIASLKTSLNNEVELAFDYLERTKAEFNKNIDSVYRSYVKRFYPNSPSGISVRNNDKENQLRFDIDVKIENQASDGINHVRIFCFDLLIMMAGFNHNIEFIFHDSRLYDGVDPRQRLEMLRLANELAADKNRQYIATLNEDHINSMQSYFSEDEIESLIFKNITLELSDESDKSKLLGIQVDMSY